MLPPEYVKSITTARAGYVLDLCMRGKYVTPLNNYTTREERLFFSEC
jgi:hypothetical protein